MNQCGKTLTAHGFNHAQGCQRVHKTRRTLARGNPLIHHQALAGMQGSILAVHGAAKHADSLTEQRLGLGTAACGDNHASALVTHGHGFIKPSLEGRQNFRGHLCLYMMLTQGLCIGDICHAQQ